MIGPIPWQKEKINQTWVVLIHAFASNIMMVIWQSFQTSVPQAKTAIIKLP